MVFPHTYRSEHTETRTTSSTYGQFCEAKVTGPKYKIESDVIGLLKYVDAVREHYLIDLNEAISIKSISGQTKYRQDVIKMIELTEKWFFKLKIKYELFDIGWEKIDGICVKMPCVILGSTVARKNLKTICLYFHLDVTSDENQNWTTNPWELTEIDKVLYGKGVASGKGPLICWLHAIEAYRNNNVPLPVNIKFIIESMSQHNSEGLENLLKAQKQRFLSNIDLIVFCHTEWLGMKYPCLSYGTGGTCKFEITAEKFEDSDPHEEMEKIFSHIVDKKNTILIPELHKSVDIITPAEERLYDDIDYDFEAIKPTLPKDKQHWDKVQMLMSFWRLPNIMLGDYEECNCEKEDKTKLKRKFIIKIVPRLSPDTTADMVTRHVIKVCKELRCRSKILCEMVYGARPWVMNFKSPAYEAARRAIIQIYKYEPNMIREDSEIPIMLMLRSVIETEIILLPIVNAKSNPGEENENITMRNFYEGTKVLIAFMKQLSISGEFEIK